MTSSCYWPFSYTVLNEVYKLVSCFWHSLTVLHLTILNFVLLSKKPFETLWKSSQELGNGNLIFSKTSTCFFLSTHSDFYLKPSHQFGPWEALFFHEFDRINTMRRLNMNSIQFRNKRCISLKYSIIMAAIIVYCNSQYVD